MTKHKIDVYTLIKSEIHKLSKVGIETANLDCRLLLTKSLKLNKTLHNYQNVNVTDNEFKNFQNFIEQRLSGKPVSRIINKKNFWDSEFELNDDTLDPRPDSETLIDAVLCHFKSRTQIIKILDLGSGTGCLGLSLLKEYPCSKASFFDVSKKSLEIVKINSLNFGLSHRSKFVNLDWRDETWDANLNKIENKTKFDVIISNPPYIPTEDIKNLQKEVKEYDPFIALNGGEDGLQAYQSIIPKLKNIMNKNGKIFFEIGKGQESYITSLAALYGLLPQEYRKDFSGVIRVITFIIK
jgi:release factor glutamine methyltransferase